MKPKKIGPLNMGAKAEQLSVHFTPRNKAQQEALDIYKDNDIIFLLGSAGTGKSHLSMALALMDMQNPVGTGYEGKKRHIDKIIVARPIVEAGERLGALPGDIGMKTDVYMVPLYDCVSRLILNSKRFIEEHIEVVPLAFQRGRTFQDCVAILDEAQNCTKEQLLMFLTRLGYGGKLIITGDPDQSDIGRNSGLTYWCKLLQDVEGIKIIQFTDADIVRHPLVAEIVKKHKAQLKKG